MPLDTLRYYRPDVSIYREVEIDDAAHRFGGKAVSSRIKIGKPLDLYELVAAHVELAAERASAETLDPATVSGGEPLDAVTVSGDYSSAATSGYRSAAATSGYRSAAATSGDRSTAASSGDLSVATTSGEECIASAEGEHSIALAGGYLSRARGALGCWLVLAERDRYGALLDVRAVRVDGETIKAGVSYALRDGEIVEAE